VAEPNVVWDRSSQSRWEVVERLAIAVVEAQERLDIAGEDRTAASRKVYSLWMWLDFGGAHRVTIPKLGRIVLSSARSEREDDTDTVRGVV
jgi:hypothetical protein